MRILPLLPFLFPLFATPAAAQTVLPPFSAHYQALDLGQLPGVGSYGGLTFDPNDPDVLLVSAYGSGEIRAVRVQRDGQGRIAGFLSSTVRATVSGNDGGLAVGPGNVLFFTVYGPNRLGQIRPGSSTEDRLIDLQPLGIGSSVGTCTFVPSGRGGAGRLKIASYGDGGWYDASLVPAGDGTFLIGQVAAPVQVAGGPEGLLYPPASAPLLGNHVLVADWNGGTLDAYQTDGNGDPLPATRQTVVAALTGPGGGAVDAVSGDLLFTDAGGALLAVRQGSTCGAITSYGQPSPGTVTPTLSASGCARLGQGITLAVGGMPSGLGVLAAGSAPLAVTIDGLRILVSADLLLTIGLDGSGQATLPIAIPVAPVLGNTHLYLQVGLLDAATAFGLSASAGLDVWIR